MSAVVRFGAGCLADVADVAAELGLERLLLVTTRRGAALAGRVPTVGVYDGVLPHAPIETVRAAAARVRALDADGIVALGGGSAIDTSKAVVAELLGERRVRTIAIPTTYAGAEWTSFFGTRLAPGRKGGGAAQESRPAAVLYDPELQLGLPVPETVGTSLNALAHAAEAYYVPSRSDRGDRHADAGARAISYALPLVVAEPSSIYARARLLDGAMRAAMALGETGLALGHAMAQGLGGRYDLPQGTMNALCLAPALRFNEPVVPQAVARLARAMRVDDAPARVEQLASLGGFGWLRDYAVPEEGLEVVAAEIVERAGAKANPRPATAADVTALLRSVW